MKIKLVPAKKRLFIPKTRSNVFQDKRLKRQKTRMTQVANAIREQ